MNLFHWPEWAARLRVPVKVRFMGLYDAVDRTTYKAPDTSLANVDHCYHARRSNMVGSRASFGTVEISGGSLVQRDFDTAHGGIGGDMGLFVPLGGLTEDYYCNALTLVLSDAELGRMWSMDTEGRHTGEPVVRSLSGKDEREKRAREIRMYLAESREADEFIRSGAEAAGFRFGGKSRHLPYGDKGKEAEWMRKLQDSFVECRLPRYECG
jgi:hypothetical protein